MAKLEKLLKLAKPHLNSGEQVLAVIQGSYETKILGSETVRGGIMMATPERIVFYAKKMGGYDLESFPYGHISSFEQSKNMMGQSVSFFASGNEVNMKWISDVPAMQQFVATVRERTGPGSPPPSMPRSNVPQSVAAPQVPIVASAPPEDPGAIIEAIRQLGELHTSGVLTEEEFTAKKAELLRRL